MLRPHQRLRYGGEMAIMRALTISKGPTALFLPSMSPMLQNKLPTGHPNGTGPVAGSASAAGTRGELVRALWRWSEGIGMLN